MTYKIRSGGYEVRVALILLLALLGIYSCTVQAQPLTPIKYVGLEASFGFRTFMVNSNIEKIDGMQAGQEGGSLGVVFGNDLLMTKLRAAGFFYSNANTPQVQQLFETAALVNFYPFELIRNNRAKVRPYITAGLSMDNVKFFGRYVDVSSVKKNNAYDPYLGKLTQWNIHGGLGVEYSFPSVCDFIHLFAEVTMGTPIQSFASTNAFESTSIGRFTSMSAGVSFGLRKF